MSFRRDREPELAWRRWVDTHEAELIAIGIPREVWTDRLTWWRFLGHAIHPPVGNARDIRFRLEDLSSDQQLRFYRFLEAALSAQDRVGCDMWTILHLRIRHCG